MHDAWPEEIPWSLWSYQSLTVSDIPQVPLMGVRFAPGFIYAFIFGCIFVAFFSWQRFQRRDEDVQSSSKALRELQPTDLGGQNALLRAYFIYAGSVLLLYISLTFFGKLIFQATQMIPVAGVSVDVAQLKFDSPQWPLTLAFAFAGLADLLPPVRLAEEWLRNRAYRAAGIPVRLEQTVRSLIATLENPSESTNEVSEDRPARSRAGSLQALLSRYSEDWRAQIERVGWAKELLGGRVSRSQELIALVSQIEVLVSWAKTARGSWPGAEVSFRVRNTETDLVDDADNLLNDLQKMLRESAIQEQTDPTVGLARFDQYLSDTTKRARSIRLELVSILAIFIERDPDVPISNKRPDPNHPRAIEALADLLRDTERPESVGSGPEAGLLVLLVPVFLVYVAGAWQGTLELVGQYVETSNLTGVLLTALLETIKLASLTWLPLLAAFSLRQYLWDTGDWAGSGSRKSYRASSRLSLILGCLGLALAASVIGLTCVAMLKAFAIASNANYFTSLLFDGANPFLLYYPTLAIIVVVLVPLSILAADARADGRSALPYAVASVIAVLFLYSHHGLFWDVGWGEKCSQVSSFTTAECARRSDTLTRVILSVLAFLSTWVLGGPAPGRARPHLTSVKAVMVAGLAIVSLSVQATPLLAKEGETVVIGFRNDVEPFSYIVRDNDGPPHYAGYLADLCYKIFEGSTYATKAIGVEADDRFARVNWEGAAAKGQIDLLCDAVTIKFGDDLRTGEKRRNENSIYSPIVFATGVSYLDRSARGATTKGGDVAIGYVAGTTATNVALKSCDVDLFKALPPVQRKVTYQRCHFMYEAARMRHGISGSAPPSNDDIREISRAAKALLESSDQIVDKDAVAKLPSHLMAIQIQTMFPKCLEDSEPAFDCPVPATLEKLREALLDPACSQDVDKTESSKQQETWREYHFCPMKSHQELIQWLCGNTASTRRVYMGDRELILGKLESWNLRNPPCIVEQPNGAEYLTYEPYALLVNKSDSNLVQFVQMRIYQIFSHRATATALFGSYFPQRKMSSALAYLFLLNAVVPEDYYAGPSLGTTPSALGRVQDNR